MGELRILTEGKQIYIESGDHYWCCIW